MHEQSPHILIFDSGVGALSVFNEVIALEPTIRCTLALDNAHFPYGTLPESQLTQRVVALMAHFIKHTQPEMVVIACNTASTLVLDELRHQFQIPFVGVVPAIKPAAKLSASKAIGLLATPGTVERSYTDNLIEDFAPDCQIVRIGSSDLVTMAEQKLRGKTLDMEQLKLILQPFCDHASLDTVVLACTHFPLLAEELKAVLPEHIQLIDSGTAIAQRVSSLLQSKPSFNTERSVHRLCLTSEDAGLDHLNSYINNLGFSRAEVVEI